MNENDIQHGVVRVFDNFKGFGFIRRDKGKDVFFFYEDIQLEERVLVEGDKVSFEIKAMPKGPRAYKIEKLG